MTNDDLAAHARAIIAGNRYLTLGTADPDGRPWATPVFFAAAAGEREYYWMSATGARHSQNLAARPQVSIVVFDSTVEPYHGRAVYADAEAVELGGADVDRALDVYPGPADRGVGPFTRDAVTAPSGYRLYRATATSLWVLCPRPPRQPCPLHGVDEDHRTLVG
jgi:hypothetical protein